MTTSFALPINVWYYNDPLSKWMLKSTIDHQETYDEFKYFRVLSLGKKCFYYTSEDYFNHNDVSPINYDNEFTNTNGDVIYLGKFETD